MDAAPATPRRLTVLFDAGCGFCLRCREWLLQEPQLVPLELLPRDAPEVAARWPGFVPGGDELTVIDDRGGVYRGPDAFLLCLWALDGYRGWAQRMATPALRPLARQAFELVSRQRHRIGDWVGLREDWHIAAELHREVGTGTPRCAG